MQAVLSCAVMHWSLVAALSWDDIDGDFLAWRYAPMFRLRISSQAWSLACKSCPLKRWKEFLSTDIKQ